MRWIGRRGHTGFPVVRITVRRFAESRARIGRRLHSVNDRQRAVTFWEG